MAGVAVRLQVLTSGAGRAVEFAALFADVGSAGAADSFLAELRPGDGERCELGLICPPSAVTWRDQQLLPLATHIYPGPGPYTAELFVDGLPAASLVVDPDEGAARAAASPDFEPVTLFAVTLVEGAAEQRLVKIQAPPLAEGQRLRIDGGAGQVRQFGGEPGQSISAEILLSYPKPGRYTVGLDLLDGEGFCIAALAQTDLEIADASAADDAPAVAEEPRFAPDERGPEESPSLAAPWLPYRNFKSKPGGARTYSSAGGGTVRRWVGTGTWMSVRRETVAGGARWYQTAGGDWIKADAVVFFEPSPLRGVELAATQPPPPPPPPPPGNRKGVVTASTLNVRARPGVSASNPPVGSLRAGRAGRHFRGEAGGRGKLVPDRGGQVGGSPLRASRRITRGGERRNALAGGECRAPTRLGRARQA